MNYSTRDLNKTVKFIIIHYTGMRKESAAIKRLCDQKSKVSAHYFIKKNGKITAVIPARSGSTRCKNKNIRNFCDK